MVTEDGIPLARYSAVSTYLFYTCRQPGLEIAISNLHIEIVSFKASVTGAVSSGFPLSIQANLGEQPKLPLYRQHFTFPQSFTHW
jgi:hypothetical protein